MRCYLYEIPENVKWSLVKEKKLVVSLGLEGSIGRSKTKGLFRKFRGNLGNLYILKFVMIYYTYTLWIDYQNQDN